MPLGAFISTGRTLDQAVDRVKLAESLGYDAAYITHIAGRDSLLVSAAYLLATERIRVGTGVIPIYTRVPASMAQNAATLLDMSGGASSSASASRTARSSRAGSARRSTSPRAR